MHFDYNSVLENLSDYKSFKKSLNITKAMAFTAEESLKLHQFYLDIIKISYNKRIDKENDLEKLLKIIDFNKALTLGNQKKQEKKKKRKNNSSIKLPKPPKSTSSRGCSGCGAVYTCYCK